MLELMKDGYIRCHNCNEEMDIAHAVHQGRWLLEHSEPDDDIVCPYCSGSIIIALQAECAALKKENEQYAAGLHEIAGGQCCETPGCCPDDPMCDVMIARAALLGNAAITASVKDNC